MMFKLDVVVEGIIDLEPGGLESSSSSSYHQTQKSQRNIGYDVLSLTYLHIGEEEMR
jgi:hypothetical protein